MVMTISDIVMVITMLILGMLMQSLRAYGIVHKLYKVVNGVNPNG